MADAIMMPPLHCVLPSFLLFSTSAVIRRSHLHRQSQRSATPALALHTAEGNLKLYLLQGL